MKTMKNNVAAAGYYSYYPTTDATTNATNTTNEMTTVNINVKNHIMKSVLMWQPPFLHCPQHPSTILVS